MALLTGGVLVFAIVHLYPAVFADARAGLVEKLGRNVYRGLFSVAVLTGVILIVVGWRSATPAVVYTPPVTGRAVPGVLVFAALVLLVASMSNTNIRRFVRHPQMTAVILWSVAHLLANGDARSLLLFGGLGIWAVVEILLTSRRDGPWQKPAPFPLLSDVITVAIGAVGFVLAWRFHAMLSGIPLAA